MVQVRDVLELIRRGGGIRRLWRAVRIRVFSRTVSFGLRRDIRIPFPVPPAKIPVVVRPLRPDDDLSCVAAEPGLSPRAAWGRLSQRRLLAADLPTCWVAADAAGKVYYLQWLIGARDNAHVRARWDGLFPELKPDEALLEGAYTAESHRGLGIMAHAMTRIAAAARDLGADHVITFVGKNNVPSLKGCEKAGFTPYVERRETWLLFQRRVRFLPLDPTAAPTHRRHTSSP